jgi:LCP family protein required for cell wall assembly
MTAGVLTLVLGAACTVRATQEARPAAPPAGQVNVLLMGLDDRDDPAVLGSRTDTLVLVHVPDRRDRVDLISVPRDTTVDIAGGYGRHKINQAFEVAKAATGSDAKGYRTVADTVGTLTGLHVDHYAAVRMPAFAELSERVGGVPVCLAKATRDPLAGADFPAGPQTVRGPSALAFVRQRHELPAGDLDRVVRQQVFLHGVLDRLSDPGVRDAVLGVARSALILDEGWDLASFAVQMKDLAGKPVQAVTVPVAAQDPELIVDPGRVREQVVLLDAGSPDNTSGPRCVA